MDVDLAPARGEGDEAVRRTSGEGASEKAAVGDICVVRLGEGFELRPTLAPVVGDRDVATFSANRDAFRVPRGHIRERSAEGLALRRPLVGRFFEGMHLVDSQALRPLACEDAGSRYGEEAPANDGPRPRDCAASPASAPCPDHSPSHAVARVAHFLRRQAKRGFRTRRGVLAR